MVAGFLVGIGVWQMSTSPLPIYRMTAHGWVSLFRGTPVLAQLLLCFYLPSQLGLDIPGFAAATLALTLNTAAYQSQILKSGFASIHPRSTGSRRDLRAEPTADFMAYSGAAGCPDNAAVTDFRAD
jgi:His/Glu/Gln/Arg/opine family amino acid ABC transporter permease subunit